MRPICKHISRPPHAEAAPSITHSPGLKSRYKRSGFGHLDIALGKNTVLEFRDVGLRLKVVHH